LVFGWVTYQRCPHCGYLVRRVSQGWRRCISSRTANPMKINLTLPSARTLLIGAAALVVAGLLAAGRWYWHATTQQRAMAVYAEAMTKAQPAQSPDATGETRAAAIRELEAALTQYPSGRDTAQVAYLLGNLRFQSQQDAEGGGAV